MRSILSLFLPILLGIHASHAAPLAQGRGIGTDLLTQFKLIEQYASAAYCSNNDQSPGSSIKCGTGNCPLVEQSNTSSIIEYERKDVPTDVTGFVALDHTHNLIVVSFRGSASLATWETDLEIDTVVTDICSGCTAHRGFWTSWTDARDRVLPAVKQASNAYPNYQIISTGHSLGAAVASLAAAQMRNSGYTVALYNFGSPRIGGSKISTYITNQPGGNYRITHWNDPIPNVPLLLMGYVHISPEYYINKPNEEEVQVGDIKVYDGSSNLSGNGAWIAVDLDAHRWYFKSVYLCLNINFKREELDIRGSEASVNIVAKF